MGRLVLTTPAARDFADIVEYIHQDDPAAAVRVREAIIASIDRLREFPGIGRRGYLAGTRELPVRSRPYLIVYEADERKVTILAVLHTARDIRRALAERQSDRLR
ncbi:type II toxin-antitoxin system RelE/ParE family toxin [Zavarzinia sp. CC-PAN008]|uniref:type II toxin-antitoxin system RelE/ParE family toxin n=1 Tax=Zavarzinia sp. CC-PAN008 TaxID=3243332 RepID=UPI003F749316